MDDSVLKVLEAQEASAEQQEFNSLSKEAKLDRLNNLIQKSQIFSNIIADTILQSSLKSKESTPENPQQPTPDVSPPPKLKKRSRLTKQKAEKKAKTDIASMLGAKPIKQTTKDTRREIEMAQEGEKHTEQPALLSGGTLKNYQLDGLRWLITLYENGLNGILADEMGLGKTIQCIALLSHLIENNITGPFLVVVPLTTRSNWANEFKKFAPKVKVAVYGGLKDERKLLDLRKWGRTKNVVLCSYEMIIKDLTKFADVSWKYMIVDEGHRLKNRESALIRCLKQLPTANRLIITGTPLQNNLNELWSLLNFILPDIFSDLNLFQQWFNFEELTSFEKDEDDAETKQLIKVEIQENLIKNLHTILKPFLLRRVKREVIKDLPPKKEYIIHIPLSPVQEKLYYDCMNKKLDTLLVEMMTRQFFRHNRDDFDVCVELIEKELRGTKKEALSKESRRSKRVTYAEAESDDEFVVDADELDESLLKIPNAFDEDLWNFSNRISPLPYEEQVPEVISRFQQIVRQLHLSFRMMQLRSICNSPYMYFDPIATPPPDHPDNAEANSKFVAALLQNSAKFQALEQLDKALAAKKHKYLVFSQFTRTLDLLEDYYTSHGVEVCRIDGNMGQEERDEHIANFYENSNARVFLLSTRLGGLGINLIPADTVVLFDSDWNPQMDLQAIDRVHRIGQTKPVKIFRFVTRDTIEELMLTRLALKRFLERLVIQMGQFKFSQLKKVMGGAELNDTSQVNVTQLLEMSRITFGRESSSIAREGYPEEEGKRFKFLSNTIEEFLDRSPECYTLMEDGEEFTVYETINNMDS